MKKPLSSAIRHLYGIGDFGFSLMTSVELYLFTFFLTNVAKFPMLWVGIIGTITALADALLSPFYGAIISGTKPMRWGRNRSWMLTMPPIVILLYMFQFTKIGSDTLAAVIVIIGFVLSHICWNLPWVANVALIPTLANDANDRALLAGRRAMFTSLAAVAYGLISTPLLGFLANISGGNEIMSYSLFAGLMALVMCLGYWLVFKITDGYEPVEVVSADAPKANRVPVGLMIKSAVQNPPLLALLVGDFFRYMANFIITAAAAYYFSYVHKNPNLLATYLVVGGLAQAVGSYISHHIAKALSNRTASILSMILAGVSLIFGRIVGGNLMLFFVAACAFRAMQGVMNATVVALYSEASIYSEWKTGANAAPFVMGLMTLSLKASVTARSIVIPLALATAGFVATTDYTSVTQEVQNACMDVFLLYPGISILFAAAIFLFFYRLTREKVNELQEEINARKAAISK
ncbi:MAG: MFS transporter [Oscillospiraceae bacterium]